MGEREGINPWKRGCGRSSGAWFDRSRSLVHGVDIGRRERIVSVQQRQYPKRYLRWRGTHVFVDEGDVEDAPIDSAVEHLRILLRTVEDDSGAPAHL